MISFSFFVRRLRCLSFPCGMWEKICSGRKSSSVFTIPRFFTFEIASCGVILFALLYVIWMFLLRYVSRSDLIIASVQWSAYKTTSLFGFLAARPMIWIRDVVERKNHSLSASKIAINETSGRSIPSLSKLIPTRISITHVRSFLIISQRSIVDTSEWR